MWMDLLKQKFHCEVYSIQFNVKKNVNYLRQVGGFLRILWLTTLIKLTTTIYLKYC